MAERRPGNKIFAGRDASEFVGRTYELETLLDHARADGSRGLALLSAPSAGLSELLRQVYDRLFAEHGGVIPIYFEFRESDVNAESAATRFLREFLVQVVAFRRRDAGIIDASPDLREIAELAAPEDGSWIDRLIDTAEISVKLANGRALVASCFSAPLRAAARGVQSFVMIDGLHVTDRYGSTEALIEILNDIYSRSTSPFVFGGLRRSLFAKTPFDAMYLEPLPFEDAGKMIENLSRRSGVVINDQTRDLTAVQLGCNAGHIASIFASAVENEAPLDNFSQVATVYTDEIYGGRIARHYDRIIDRAFPDAAVRLRVLKLLRETIDAEAGLIPYAYWLKQTGIAADDLDNALSRLHIAEIVNFTSGWVGVDTSDVPFCDYVRARARLELERAPRALAVGESLAENVQRAPKLMAAYYKQVSALDLDGLMQAFDGQQISGALIDYGRFKSEVKGADDERILKAVREDNERLALPKIVYTAHTGAFYPRLDELCVRERSVVGLGFADAAARDEIAWIAAEIESKLEASRETAEFWCDRLELAAIHSNFAKYRLWLIAPEGFSDDALAALRERNAFGTSRRQVKLLAQLLNAGVTATAAEQRAEYEMTVPMGDDTEMIAAHAVEDIARRHGFPAKTINQIKTALVEACINASEHSLSPDRRIQLRFVVYGDQIEITVANRGLRLADANLKAVETAGEGRRGWGLKLIQSLMDDVRIERSDDGTRITMKKSIKPQR